MYWVSDSLKHANFYLLLYALNDELISEFFLDQTLKKPGSRELDNAGQDYEIKWDHRDVLYAPHFP